ncbi:ribosome biogenesis GTP-binding protein YihA/YsxC [Marinicella sp. W31]|uniref:ribosome biogenesis GTP-binding protein YihA/YsxC n=1 Tax=Marinicella sp. W31 TaxID=3023713 RepID=UPI003756E8E0
MPNIFTNSRFLISAHKVQQLPPDNGQEIAFAGRSNAGKSTTINALTNHRGLAKVSKTPGRTQLLNCFEFAPGQRLVDLPGYGYAKVPEKMRKHWQQEINRYLLGRQSLIGIVLIMDIRHPMKEFDQQMLAWAHQSEMKVHLLLNKADKLSSSQVRSTLEQVKKTVAEVTPNASVQTFSALRKTGAKELSAVLQSWFKTV